MGAFNLNIPAQLTAGPAAPGAGVQTRSAPLQLAGGIFAPTVMEEWVLKALRIPFTVYAEQTAPGGAAPLLRCEARLLIGGDIVWTQVLENLATAGPWSESGELAFNANAAFSDSLVNPIGYRRGRTLTLQVIAECVNRALAGLNVRVSEQAAATKAGGWFLDQGNIQYESNALTGHRTL